MADSFSAQVLEPHLDALLGGTLLSAILAGAYAIIFFHTIVPVWRSKAHVLLALLIALFCMDVIVLGEGWRHLRDIVIVHNTSPRAMYNEFFQPIADEVGDVALVLSVFIADIIMVWRCCNLWKGRKVVYSAFALLLLTETAMVPLFIVQEFFKLDVAPKVNFLCIFLFISVGVTALATSLITYRILGAGKLGSYSYIIEAVVQSGVMYSLTLLLASTLLAIRLTHPLDTSLIEATSYAGQLIAPITGIATTLISSRITSRAEVKGTTALVVSEMVFNRAAMVKDPELADTTTVAASNTMTSVLHKTVSTDTEGEI